MGAQASVANCCAGRDKLGDGSLPLHSSQRCLADEVSASAPRARRGCKFGDGCRRGNPSHFVDESHPGDPDAVVGRPRVPLVQPGPQLASREKSFEWVRTANEKEDRELRGATASLTLKACHASGYQLDNDVVALRMVDQMLQGTRMLTLEEVSATLSAPFFASWPRLRRSRCLALEAAQGARVAVLSAASAYHPCGGFRSGGRHALEEAMCVQSTLCVSLQRALYLSQHGSYKVELPQRLVADGRTSAWFCYISERGCILSPHVEVFRQGSNAGYGFMAEPQELAAVVSVAMPNKNPAVRDSPLDAPGQAEEYHDLLVAKLKVALGAAALAGATTVVVPGLGCGVFKNAPEDVGRALKEALAWPPLRQLEEIILAAVPDAFAAAAGA